MYRLTLHSVRCSVCIVACNLAALTFNNVIRVILPAYARCSGLMPAS